MERRFAFYCNVLMVLTSIHHIYGAYIYHTPWRLHVLALSIPVFLINWYTMNRKQPGKILFTLFYLVNLVATVSLIGFYEGVYNHLAKNILYYSGTGSGTMERLFPPPTYVMPNDFLFELTGVMQAFVLVPILYHFTKKISSLIKQYRDHA